MDFFIKQHSSLPYLSIKIEDKLLHQYGLEKDDFDNVAVTFSMTDSNNHYKIANVPAELVTKPRVIDFGNEFMYWVQYKFSKEETKYDGVFNGEFKIDFLDNPKCGSLTLPNDKLYIYIQPAITKTTVVRPF